MPVIDTASVSTLAGRGGVSAAIDCHARSGGPDDMADTSSDIPGRILETRGVPVGGNRNIVQGGADSGAMNDVGKPGAGERM
jgi:hypothetical protein